MPRPRLPSLSLLDNGLATAPLKPSRWFGLRTSVAPGRGRESKELIKKSEQFFLSERDSGYRAMRLRRLRVLPMLHSNGYKMANPTVLGRLGDEELTQLFTGYRYKPYFVEGDDPEAIQQLMAATVDAVIAEIHAIQDDARSKRSGTLPVWPLIVLRVRKVGLDRSLWTVSPWRAGGAHTRCRSVIWR